MTSERFITITIDGGAASGKSTTARKLAEELNLLHVDTGTHYRAITLILLNKGIAPEDKDNLNQALDEVALDTEIEKRFSKIKINGKCFAHDDLRAKEVNQNVSNYSAVPEVRKLLLKYERQQEALAQKHGFKGVVMEGRDIGSVVLPNAPFRFFLHADTATRSSRRAAEGESDSIQERDKIDSQRKTAPLICPAGATMIDTSRLSLEEVIEKIVNLIKPNGEPANARQ